MGKLAAVAQKVLDRKVYIAINRAMTPQFDRWAKKTHRISGKRLLAKVAAAEGGGTTQKPNVSSAGARGPFQFIKSTRAAYKSKYGLDAWRTNTEAAKAAMIHLKGTGVAGYNPGMPSYTNLVLGQNVNTDPLKTGGFGGSGKVRGGGKGGGRGGGGGLRQGRKGVPAAALPTTTTRDPVEPGGTGLASLLSEMMDKQKPQPIQSAGVQAPAFSAAAPMPRGYQDISSGGPAPQVDKSSLADLLSGVGDLQGQGVPQSKVTGGGVLPGRAPSVEGRPRGGGGRGGRGGGGRGPGIPKGGKLIGSPQDRPGVRTNPKVVELVRRASAWGKMPIQLGTGTQHSKMTSSGNVSDHWGGNGLDLPAAGRKGDRIAGALLVQLGVPRAKARRMAQQGGGFTINRKGRRYQVIWKTSANSTYGDHTDHVHVGRG